MAACDYMIGKIGYGTVSEALSYKLPFVFVRRDFFNEEPFVRNMLEYYQNGVEMIRRDLLTGRWAPYLQRAISLKPCYEGGVDGGKVTARILQDMDFGKNNTPQKNHAFTVLNICNLVYFWEKTCLRSVTPTNVINH
ncbi:L-arabinokinase-like [Papaver somniferum]|uniref:L-arabinokinase-like n=1 Tax=Papaver somniferum TaxID=3469 RepID=UPI000E6FEAA5|nr:L-arabinokinase-like [Papaver somniferum]